MEHCRGYTCVACMGSEGFMCAFAYQFMCMAVCVNISMSCSIDGTAGQVRLC